MSYKMKQRRFVGGLIMVVFLLVACNFLTEGMQHIGNASTPFTPGDPTATPLGSDITDPNFIKGVEAFSDKNYRGTIILMSAVIDTNPNLAPPYRYRGAALSLLGDCAAGLADAEKAISLVPEYAAAWGIRGLSYGCLGNTQQQLQDYEKALSLDPSLAFVHHNLGYYYFLQGDYERSLEEYDLTVAIDPNRSFTWSSMGEVKSWLGLYDECIAYATKALNINAEEWVAYSVRAVCQQFRGDPQAAIQDYHVYLEHNPTDASRWSNLGNAQRDAALLDDALTSHNKALELDPSYYQANINRGLVYTDLGEYDKALDDFNRALEFGDIPAAYSGRGTVYYWMKKYDDAITDLETAAREIPDRPHILCMLTLSYFEAGRYRDSLDTAARVNGIASACSRQRLLEIQARSSYALGEYEQAVLYINKAFEIGEYTMGYYYRGIMYQAAGNEENAISDLKHFLVLAEDNPDLFKEIDDTESRLEELEQ